jgi:integrase
MSVRKRVWRTKDKEIRSAFVVDYTDQHGNRAHKQFSKESDAKLYHAKVSMEVHEGTHSVPSRSITIAKACDLWLTACEGKKLEAGTLAQYRQHCALHIKERIGRAKLAKLTTAGVKTFRDNLLGAGMSPAMARKVLVSLKAVISEAQESNLVAQNVARPVRVTISNRTKARPVIPTTAELRAIFDAAKDNQRVYATILTAAFAGLRSSEIRGLRWRDIEFRQDGGTIAVEQRADRYGVTGEPKSAAGRRTIPIGPKLVETLRLWRVRSKYSRPDDLVFTVTGRPLQHKGMLDALHSAQRAAKIVSDGKPKYGLHSLRHYYASLCINRKVDGGLELPVKNVSVRMGHSSIVITLDTYGHLFPSDDTGKELAEAELRVT